MRIAWIGRQKLNAFFACQAQMTASAAAVTRVVSTFLVGVSATDPITFAGVPALLLAVAIVATFVPARRASRVDPNVALRDG